MLAALLFFCFVLAPASCFGPGGMTGQMKGPGGAFPGAMPQMCDDATIQDTLVNKRKEVVEILKSGDAAATAAAFFTTDGSVMTPGAATYQGQEQLATFLTNFGAPPDMLAQQATTYKCLGPMYAIEMGPYANFVRVLNVWKMEPDGWKIQANMDTGDNPTS